MCNMYIYFLNICLCSEMLSWKLPYSESDSFFLYSSHKDQCYFYGTKLLAKETRNPEPALFGSELEDGIKLMLRLFEPTWKLKENTNVRSNVQVFLSVQKLWGYQTHKERIYDCYCMELLSDYWTRVQFLNKRGHKG